MKQLRSWHLSALKVISGPKSALARTSERDGRTRTTIENCAANESWTRTKYGYDSFGKQTSSSGSLTNPFQYTGRESDSESNVYFYRARYYDQNAGRFLSEDPKRFDAGINFYAYVANNSPNKTDPFGLKMCWTKLVVTGVSNCSVQFVSAKGLSCKFGDPKGQVESLCDQLQKAIQKDGSADFPAMPCPSGECCKDLQPQ